VQLHGCGVSSLVDGVRDSGVKVVGDGEVLVAGVGEQCLVVGLHDLSEQGSDADVFSRPRNICEDAKTRCSEGSWDSSLVGPDGMSV